MTDRYDDIVVGGGSAGCLVAARLSGSGRSVLLLEAGPDRTDSISPPLRDGFGLARGTDWPDDWGYTPEPDARGQSGPLRRGRFLGGTSWLTRFAVRGSPADFDGWAARGLTGLSFDDLLPSFRRIETDLDFGTAPWHGTDGPLPIDRYRSRPLDPVHEATVDACLASGFAAVEDHNRPGAVGVGRMPMSSRDGRRVSSSDAFLPPGGRPASLEIRPECLVDRVMFDGDQARGVRLADGRVIAADRVILSAGVFGSPAILLRSGIGAAAALRELGIPILRDLPGVGANLADHPAAELALDVVTALQGGPQLHSIATWHSSSADASGPPDVMFWFADPTDDPPEISIEVVLLKPHSRGRVGLRSRNPEAAPRIRLPGIATGDDVARLVEGLGLALEIAGLPGMAALTRRSARAPESGGDIARFVADEHYSIPHTVGTCAMGTATEDGAVVDTRGRVHGVRGLHVVDASILPEAPSGFPNLVTLAIADAIAGRLLSLPD